MWIRRPERICARRPDKKKAGAWSAAPYPCEFPHRSDGSERSRAGPTGPPRRGPPSPKRAQPGERPSASVPDDATTNNLLLQAMRATVPTGTRSPTLHRPGRPDVPTFPARARPGHFPKCREAFLRLGCHAAPSSVPLLSARQTSCRAFHCFPRGKGLLPAGDRGERRRRFGPSSPAKRDPCAPAAASLEGFALWS